MRAERDQTAREDLLQAMPIGFVVLNSQKIILEGNQAAQEILGRSLHAMLGKPAEEFFPNLAGILNSFEREATQYAKHEISLNHHPVLLDVMGFGAGYMLFLTAKGVNPIEQNNPAPSMAAILAHELKNPLAGIRGAAQLLEGRLEDKNRTLAELIKNECDRIAGLIDSYGALGSDEAPTLININEILDHALQIARHGFAASITLEGVFDPSLPEIPGKRNQLIQAVLNLLNNASEAGDRIILRTLYAWGPILTQPGKERQRLGLAIEVEDNGPGVPEALQRNIFDPFVTSKRGGRGLGLAQVRQAAQDHFGTIEYRAQPTIFRLTLPIALPRRDS